MGLSAFNAMRARQRAEAYYNESSYKTEEQPEHKAEETNSEGKKNKKTDAEKLKRKD